MSLFALVRSVLGVLHLIAELQQGIFEIIESIRWGFAVTRGANRWHFGVFSGENGNEDRVKDKDSTEQKVVRVKDVRDVRNARWTCSVSMDRYFFDKPI